MKSLVCWLISLFPLICGHNEYSLQSEGYSVYSISPGSLVRIFTYRPGVIALVYQNSSHGIVVQLQRVDSFERSSPFTVKETAHSHHYRIEACFERDGYAHLLAYDMVLNETLVIRGQRETFIPLRDYDLLRYDIMKDHVYLARNGNVLHYKFDDILQYNDIGEIPTPPVAREKISDTFSDLLVMNDQQLAIFDQAVNHRMTNGTWRRLMPTQSDIFWFQLVPPQKGAEPGTALGQLSPTNVLFVVEICVLLFAAYCLNFKLKLRPQSGGVFELSRVGGQS